MRIVGFFIRSLLTLALIAAVVYVVGGQVWMAVSLRSLFTHIAGMERAVTDISNNNRLCQSAPAASDFSRPKALQLRFIDDQTYHVELICTLIENSPVVISEGKLPMFIHKDPGSSGFYMDLENPEASSFTIRSLRASKKLVFDEKLLAAGATAPQISTAALPRTACAGFGYQCCQPTTQKGVGTQLSTGVLDCPTSCYSACTPIPSVVAFTSDPYPSNSEVVMSSSTVTVTFSYTTTYSGGKITKVKLDYGDGSVEESPELIGIFTHTYTCNGQCRYKAVLHVESDSGNSSVESDASTLYIVRR